MNVLNPNRALSCHETLKGRRGATYRRKITLYHSHEKKDDEPHEHKLGHAHLARLPECFSDQPCHGPTIAPMAPARTRVDSPQKK